VTKNRTTGAASTIQYKPTYATSMGSPGLASLSSERRRTCLKLRGSGAYKQRILP